MKFILSLSIFVHIFYVHGQLPIEGSVRWGESVQGEFSPLIFSLSRMNLGILPYSFPIGEIGNELIFIRKGVNNKSIQILSKDKLSHESNYQLQLTYEGNSLALEQSFIVKDKLVLCTSYKNKSTNKVFYFFQTYLGKGNLSKPKPIGSIDHTGVEGERNKKIALSYNAFKVIQSKDKKQFFIVYPKSIDSEKQNLYFAKVYGNDLKVKTSFEFLMSNSNIEQIDELKVSTAGVAHALCRGHSSTQYEFEKDQNGFFKFAGNEVYAVTIDFNQEKVLVEQISPPLAQDYMGIHVEIVDGGAMYFGLYGVQKSQTVTGSFFYKISSGGELMFQTENTFEEGFISQSIPEKMNTNSDKKSKKASKEGQFYNFVLKDLILKENGDVVLLAEQHYLYFSAANTYSIVGSSGSTFYVYNDVLAINCSKEGNITWNKLIHKRQKSANDGGLYSSFFPYVKGNKIHLVFNSTEYQIKSIKLENNEWKDKQEAKNNVVAAVAVLDNKGNEQYDILFDFKGKNTRKLIPKLCKRFSEEEVFLYTKLTNKKYIFGWLRLI